MAKKHSIQERLIAVQRYLNGEPSTYIAKQTGVDHHDIITYSMRYQQNGLAGLEDKPIIKHRGEEKIKAVEEYLEGSLTLEQIAFKYNASLSSFKSWLKSYRKKSTEAFTHDKENAYYLKLRMTKLQKDPKEMTNEELQERLKDLEAENALLKKVRALVEKKDAQRQGIGSKPSTN